MERIGLIFCLVFFLGSITFAAIPVSEIERELATEVAKERAAGIKAAPIINQSLKPAHGVTIEIKKDDFYASIARQYCQKGTASLSALVVANGKTLKTASLIYPGDKIFIPWNLLKEEYKNPLPKLIKKHGEVIRAEVAFVEKNLQLSKELMKVSDLEKALAFEQKRASEYLKAALIAFVLYSAALIVAGVWARKRMKKYVSNGSNLSMRLAQTTKFLNVTDETIGKLRQEAQKLKHALEIPRMRLEFQTGEKFTFPEEQREGGFLIYPFYLETARGKEIFLQDKDKARDVIKSFIKRALNGEDVPEVKEAIKELRLIQLKSAEGKKLLSANRSN